MTKILELVDITFFDVISNISFSLKTNELITITGPNGGGKSTILEIIAGIKKQSRGKIIKETDLRVGYMPQSANFDKILPINVYDYLTLDKKVSLEYLDSKIEAVGIKNLLKKQIYNLSGGELQKVLFVGALSNKPNLLILDEPINNLDITARDEFYRIIEKEKKNCSIIMSSHDIHVVMKKTDKVICINKKLCCQGHPEIIKNDQSFINMFGQNLLLYRHDHSDF
jgi:zinc transport system ATP-binding protein